MRFKHRIHLVGLIMSTAGKTVIIHMVSWLPPTKKCRFGDGEFHCFIRIEDIMWFNDRITWFNVYPQEKPPANPSKAQTQRVFASFFPKTPPDPTGHHRCADPLNA